MNCQNQFKRGQRACRKISRRKRDDSVTDCQLSLGLENIVERVRLKDINLLLAGMNKVIQHGP